MEYNWSSEDRLAALRIVAIYAAVSAAWIYLSDRVLGLLVADSASLVHYSVLKGFLFIAVTVALLYLLITRYLRQLREAEDALRRLNEGLELRVAERTEELERQHKELEDATEKRIRAMEELRVKDQMMIQQSRLAAMGEMLSNIAHYWRQPLNVVGLNVQEIGFCFERGVCNKELVEANIGKVMAILRQLSQTIDDFRDFSTPDQEKSVFRIDEAVQKTLSLIEEGFRQRGVTVEVSCSGDPSVDGYPNEFRQVLLNILMNARDTFAEKGIRSGTIKLRSWSEQGKAVVTIADSAGGIEAEVIDRIFDPFFTTKGSGKGTGVGLFMAKNIIEKKMGGRLTVRNVDGGAEFRIEV